MSIDCHVLLISTKLDPETDTVIRALLGIGARCTRLNTEDLPFRAGITTTFIGETASPSSVYLEPDKPEVLLEDAASIWYRRVRVPERPEEMLPGVYDFCLRETRAALMGSLLTHRAPVMSPPANVWKAEYKPFQLTAARRSGLVTPETLISNDPLKVRAMFRRLEGKMIAKPVRTGFVDCGSEQRAIYTTALSEEHLNDIESARWSPAIYQPLIEKRSDIRVTVVGDKMFAAEIDSQGEPTAKVDWRRTLNPSLPHRQIELPQQLRDALFRLMSLLGLVFGAIDLIRTPDDNYLFLEVNPNGQWLWLDDALHFGISDTVVGWLLGERS